MHDTINNTHDNTLVNNTISKNIPHYCHKNIPCTLFPNYSVDCSNSVVWKQLLNSVESGNRMESVLILDRINSNKIKSVNKISK